LPFLSRSLVQWQSYHSGQIWPAPRVLFFPASGLLLARPPLLSLFPHSSWKSNVPAGTRFTITTKAQILLPQAAISAAPSFKNKKIPQCKLMKWV
jgi:hypothetical protein